MPYRVSVRASYDSALFIPGASGAAGRTHGHGYTAEAVVETERLGDSGFVADFDRLQPALAAIVGDLDHRLLNELEPFQGGVPSAERQAEYIYQRLSQEITREYGPGLHLVRVRVRQEPDAWAEYAP